MIGLITERYKLIVSLFILVSILFGYFYVNQTFYSQIFVYFDQDAAEVIDYKAFQEIYGNDELGVLVFKVDDVFQSEYLGIIDRITQILEKTAGVQRVFSITTAEEVVADNDTIGFKLIVPKGHLDKKTIKSVKKNILNHDVLLNSLISKDSTTTAVMMEIESNLSNIEKIRLFSKIKQKVKNITKKQVKLRYSGTPFLENEIDSLTRKDNNKFTPVILLIVFVIASLLLKNIFLALICIINILLVTIWGVGFFTMCGESINMLTVIIAPVLLVVSVADSIHILSHYKDVLFTRKYGHKHTIRIVINDLWKPCLLTSVTTAAGFASFVVSDIRPVEIMGIFIGIGVMMAFFLTLFFLPAIMMMVKQVYKPCTMLKCNLGLKDYPEQRRDWLADLLTKISYFSISYYKQVCICFLAVVVTSFAGISKMSYETSFVNYLPDDNKIKSDINFIEKNLCGSVPVVMLIQAKSVENDFTHRESLKVVEDLQQKIMKAMPGSFTASFSVVDYIKEVNRAFNAGGVKYFSIPENDLDIKDYYEIGSTEILDRLISPDRMEIKISFNSYMRSNETLIDMRKLIKILTNGEFKDKYSYKLTGISVLWSLMDKNLKYSQYKSFFSAFLIISLIMFFICKKKKLTILSIIPNVFSIIATFGVMGWFNISLDITTVMIASVTMGIAVDDTIHYVVWYRRNILSGFSVESSIVKTGLNVGKPILITSLLLCMGFLVLCFASLIPVKLFGILTCLSIFFAFIGDLIVFPALLMCFKPHVV